MQGRPLKFTSVAKLKEACDEYFAKCDEREEPYTITGLALHIGTCRQTLLNYEGKNAFLDTIKEAKLKCENYAEKRLFHGSPAGPIFALKNYGWTDKPPEEESHDDLPPSTVEIVRVSAKKK